MLEVGKTYVWEVQARDRQDIPIGEYEGRSQTFRFFFRIGATPPERPPADEGGVVAQQVWPRVFSRRGKGTALKGQRPKGKGQSQVSGQLLAAFPSDSIHSVWPLAGKPVRLVREYVVDDVLSGKLAVVKGETLDVRDTDTLGNFLFTFTSPDPFGVISKDTVLTFLHAGSATQYRGTLSRVCRLVVGDPHYLSPEDDIYPVANKLLDAGQFIALVREYSLTVRLESATSSIDDFKGHPPLGAGSVPGSGDTGVRSGVDDFKGHPPLGAGSVGGADTGVKTGVDDFKGHPPLGAGSVGGGDTGVKTGVDDFKGHPPLGAGSVPGSGDTGVRSGVDDFKGHPPLGAGSAGGADTGVKTGVDDFKGHPPLGASSVPGGADSGSVGSGVSIWIGRDAHILAGTQDTGLFNLMVRISDSLVVRESIQVVACGVTDNHGEVEFSRMVLPDTYYVAAKLATQIWPAQRFSATWSASRPRVAWEPVSPISLRSATWNREWPHPEPKCLFPFEDPR
jgi:hypothetical protein